MASLLTTIYAEVVKTAAIRKFSHASIRASSSPDSPYSPLLLSRSCSPGVLQKRPISERAWDDSRECGLRMAAILTTSTRIVVKIAAIRNQEPRHPCLLNQSPRARIGKLHALTLAKPASLWQQDDAFASASPPLRSGKDYAFMQTKGRSLAPARRPEVKDSVFDLPFIL